MEIFKLLQDFQMFAFEQLSSFKFEILNYCININRKGLFNSPTMVVIGNSIKEYFHVSKAIIIIWTINVCIQVIISALRFLKYREVVSLELCK